MESLNNTRILLYYVNFLRIVSQISINGNKQGEVSLIRESEDFYVGLSGVLREGVFRSTNPFQELEIHSKSRWEILLGPRSIKWVSSVVPFVDDWISFYKKGSYLMDTRLDDSPESLCWGLVPPRPLLIRPFTWFLGWGNKRNCVSSLIEVVFPE